MYIFYIFVINVVSILQKEKKHLQCFMGLKKLKLLIKLYFVFFLFSSAFWMLISQQQTRVRACVRACVMKLRFTSPRCSPRGRFSRWRSSTAGSGSWRCWAADARSSSADTLETHDPFTHTHTHTLICIYHSLSVSSTTHLQQRSYWAEPSSDPSAPASPCSPWRNRHSSVWSSVASMSLCTHLCDTHTHIRTWRLTPQQTLAGLCRTSFIEPAFLHHADLRHDGRGFRVIGTSTW